MDNMLSDLPYILNYLDHTIIMSASFEEHLEHLQVMLQRFLVNGFMLNGAKCHFSVDKIDFPGFEVTRDGVSPDLRKLQAITAIAPPIYHCCWRLCRYDPVLPVTYSPLVASPGST
jgi:hypothetical protein